MMLQPVSVIVVSRHRAAALMRCLVALTQQDHPNFEVIVVADPDAVGQVKTLNLPLKLIAFDEPNISAARNAGLAEAAAPLVAFIDDDAVAEPTWLTRIAAPFAKPDVIAATGFIRGRNGISYQWQACEVDALGQDHLLDITGNTLRQGTPQRAVKTQGTNCAFRREVLLDVGGFDPGYRFYLDEADLNLRLASHGLTAIIPDAQVHHGYQASDRRTASRVPLDLSQIAASTAFFLRRHAPEADFTLALARLRLREVMRLTAHVKAGRLEFKAAEALMAGLQRGWEDGLSRPLTRMNPLQATRSSLHPLQTGPRPGKILSGRSWQKHRLIARATASHGLITTVIVLSPTARSHCLSFQTEGYWLQTGGVFGRSLREGRRLRLISFRRRVAEETARLAPYRPVG